MNKEGFLSLIILLITVLIIALLFFVTNPFTNYGQKSLNQYETAPQRIQETQDVVDSFNQKSIERQSIEIE